MYVVRKEIMEKLLYNLRYGIDSIIVGVRGSGKTSLLKYLESFTPNAYYVVSAGPKQLLTQLLKKNDISFKPSELINDLLIKSKKIKNLTLLVDDADKLSKPAKRILEELNAHLIFASEKEIISNFEALRLESFNDEELKIFLKSMNLSKDIYLKVYSFIKNYSDPNPLNAKKIADYYNKGLGTAQIHSIQAFTSKRIEVFTIASILAIAYLLMSLRFLFYFQKNFQLGYALGTAAYILFFLFRRKKK